MSRVGKMPVAVPKGVDVAIQDDQISVKGKLGTLSLRQNALVKVEQRRRQADLRGRRRIA